jgi:hypothetical protein
LNRGKRFCRPLHNHSGTSPPGSKYVNRCNALSNSCFVVASLILNLCPSFILNLCSVEVRELMRIALLNRCQRPTLTVGHAGRAVPVARSVAKRSSRLRHQLNVPRRRSIVISDAIGRRREALLVRQRRLLASSLPSCGQSVNRLRPREPAT